MRILSRIFTRIFGKIPVLPRIPDWGLYLMVALALAIVFYRYLRPVIFEGFQDAPESTEASTPQPSTESEETSEEPNPKKQELAEELKQLEQQSQSTEKAREELLKRIEEAGYQLKDGVLIKVKVSVQPSEPESQVCKEVREKILELEKINAENIAYYKNLNQDQQELLMNIIEKRQMEIERLNELLATLQKRIDEKGTPEISTPLPTPPTTTPPTTPPTTTPPTTAPPTTTTPTTTTPTTTPPTTEPAPPTTTTPPTAPPTTTTPPTTNTPTEPPTTIPPTGPSEACPTSICRMHRPCNPFQTMYAPYYV